MQKIDGKITEKMAVHKMVIPCEGTGSGHPRVFLKIDPKTKTTTCPYCDRVFEYDGDDEIGH